MTELKIDFSISTPIRKFFELVDTLIAVFIHVIIENNDNFI